MFLQYTQRWSKDTYKIYLSCNSNNLPGYFNLIITFSVVYSPRKRDHCYWVPNKGNSHLSLVYTSKFLLFRQGKRQCQAFQLTRTSFHCKICSRKRGLMSNGWCSFRRWCKRLNNDSNNFEARLFSSCPNNPPFQRERKSIFLKYETMSAYHFYGKLDEHFPTNDTKNFVVSVKAGKKGNTFAFLSRKCPPGWTIQIQ